MGKKTKVGKNRRDKFYSLAKEAGYRSRAAFKLLQLNQTYSFLNEANTCIDLCAAPGGWLQVAAKYMPVSSQIVGVDLFPIKAIKNVKTFCADITSERCRSELKRLLNQAQADVVLHDGAPNMGTSWLLDAYNQNVLSLRALHLAVEFLKPGGWFITKLFRSKDYFSFCWVAQQFFKQIHTTKPSASRIESSEIFVICHGFNNVQSYDPRFFDDKFVFKEVQCQKPIQMTVNSLFPKQSMRKPRNRDGYPDDTIDLFKRLPAMQFIESDDYVNLLGQAYVIEIDNDAILNNKATTPEILKCLEDIKVLGKREIRGLLKWRAKIREELHDPVQSLLKASAMSSNDNDVCMNQSDSCDEEYDQLLADAEHSERSALRRKRKREAKQKKNHQTRLALKMINPGDEMDLQNEPAFTRNQANELKQIIQSNPSLTKPNSSTIVQAEKWFAKASLNVGADEIPLDDVAINEVTGHTTDEEDDENITVKIKKKNKEEKRGSKQSHEALTAEELAIAHVMKQSKTSREDLIDQGYHRYTGYGDTEGLPKWFLENEELYCRRPVEAPKELVNEYKDRTKQINVRPIKKVIEAKQRKRNKYLRLVQKMVKKVDDIPEDIDPSERQKKTEEIYKGAREMQKKKKRQVQLVVYGKGSVPKKGRYKFVDKRLKKDKRKKNKR